MKTQYRHSEEYFGHEIKIHVTEYNVIIHILKYEDNYGEIAATLELNGNFVDLNLPASHWMAHAYSIIESIVA